MVVNRVEDEVDEEDVEVRLGGELPGPLRIRHSAFRV
jgi:hypothetical protein